MQQVTVVQYMCWFLTISNTPVLISIVYFNFILLGQTLSLQTTNILSVWTRYIKSMERGWLNQELAQTTNHLKFLYRCRDFKLVPPSLTWNIPVNSWRVQKFTKWFECVNWSETDFITTNWRNIKYDRNSLANLLSSCKE